MLDARKEGEGPKILQRQKSRSRRKVKQEMAREKKKQKKWDGSQVEVLVAALRLYRKS